MVFSGIEGRFPVQSTQAGKPLQMGAEARNRHESPPENRFPRKAPAKPDWPCIE
jgi:hypothetical protein